MPAVAAFGAAPPAAHAAVQRRQPRCQLAPATASSSSSSSIGSAAGRRGRRLQRLPPCRGFVGEGSRIAGEYHDADFRWEDVEAEGRAAVQRQMSERAEHLQQLAAAGSAAAGSGGAAGAAAVEEEQAVEQAAAAAGPALSSSRAEEEEEEAEGSSWEEFHATHSQARFFKEKRYLMLEFPALGVQEPPQHIAEIGCGCGSALLPVLKANPSCRITACDVSPTALRLLRQAAQQAGVDPGRITSFVLDASSSWGGSSQLMEGSGDAASGSSGSSSSSSSGNGGGPAAAAGSPLAGLGANCLLLVFTLSALRPDQQPAALAHAYAALRPGGLLLFRDYGLYDMAQLRFPGSQMLGESLYRRSEGTLAFFFSTGALRELAAAAGFEEVECQYACVENKNRKRRTAMRRVFVHGVFRKPLD